MTPLLRQAHAAHDSGARAVSTWAVALSASAAFGFLLVRLDGYGPFLVAVPAVSILLLHLLTTYRSRELLLWLTIIVAVLNFTPALFHAQSLTSESLSQKALKDILILLLGVMAFGVYTGPKREANSVKRLVSQLIGSCLLFALVMLADVLARGGPVAAFFTSLRYYAIYPLAVIAVWQLRLSPSEVRRLLRGIAVVGALEGVLAVLNFLGIVGTTYYDSYVHLGGGAYSRATATLGNPNNLGLFMGLAAILLLNRTLFSDWRARLLLLPVALGLLASFSKTATVALALALVSQGLFSGAQSLTRARAILVAGVAAVFGYVIVAGRLGGSTSAEALLGGRSAGDSLALGQWTHDALSTLTGTGYGILSAQIGSDATSSQAVDNMPLFVAVEGGLIGLLLGVGIVVLGMRLVRASRRLSGDPVIISIETYCVFFLLYSPVAVNFRLFPGALLFWLLVGFAVTLSEGRVFASRPPTLGREPERSAVRYGLPVAQPPPSRGAVNAHE